MALRGSFVFLFLFLFLVFCLLSCASAFFLKHRFSLALLELMLYTILFIE